MFKKITAIGLLAALFIMNSGLQHEAATAAPITEEHHTIKQQAKSWINELASQSNFSNWKTAQLHISPLGPGTHSWLVLVKQQEQTVGYMVIHAVQQGGYQLGEYGTGDYPLFDDRTLQLSLMQLELIHLIDRADPLYVHPLQAAWQITANKEVYYTDAFTGEQLPIDSKGWLQAANAEEDASMLGHIHAGAKLRTAVSIPSFDPFGRLPWLSGKPLELSNEDDMPLLNLLQDQLQTRYVTERFEGQMLYAWSVVGYQEWEDDHIYIALDSDEDDRGRRYVALPLLIEFGHFYR